MSNKSKANKPLDDDCLGVTNRLVAISWCRDSLKLLDQRSLPSKLCYVHAQTAAAVADAISLMVVRGAPAIGISAAYGIALEYRRLEGNRDGVARAFQVLAESRPTAVNLHHALDAMQVALKASEAVNADWRITAQALNDCAIAYHDDDIQTNLQMVRFGVQAIQAQSSSLSKQRVLTHCNTGDLATGGVGTALGVVKALAETDQLKALYATETRPWLQGSRLTAFELSQAEIAFEVITEGAVASLFAARGVDWVIVGADRIAANGDVANKIGTYMLAILAQHFKVKVMVVAPMSTVDFKLSTGAEIPIELRGAFELIRAAGYEDTAKIAAYNPVFDVTPHHLVDLIITEHGAIAPKDLINWKDEI